jgi:hypothetical protein
MIHPSQHTGERNMALHWIDCCAEGEARYWVEAELQIPGGNVSTVQATVKEA